MFSKPFSRYFRFSGVVLVLILGISWAPDGIAEEGDVSVSGSLKAWQPVTLSFEGPETGEQGTPNPFLDYRLTVTFSSRADEFIVPGYFAADGNAGETGAGTGPIWRVHFVPSREGVWNYCVSFRQGPGIAILTDPEAGIPAALDGVEGEFIVGSADSEAPGFLGKGMLRYVGERYLRFALSGEYFLKGGADSPENFLGYVDFDGTPPTHRYEPHLRDWEPGDPTWLNGKGKGLIGALNYLAAQGMNSVYFLTMNVEGDGEDVWPWTDSDERFRFDCSKLDQWEVVFSHMDRIGLLLHVITQEEENDQLLDGGELGPERKLYFRELIARFAHHLAVVWNLGEENTNTTAQQKAFSAYIRSLDPYDHPIVAHTFPDRHDEIYTPLLAFPQFDGASLQADMERTHDLTLQWVRRSAQAGKPWIVCMDEFGPPEVGLKPDSEDPDHDDVRRYALWGNLMAGGGGCEWLFGYGYPNHDLNCEDWRSRELMWAQTRHALTFFQRYLPFQEMESDDSLVRGEGAWCLAKPGEVYAVYLWKAHDAAIRLPEGSFTVHWYNPRAGGELSPGGSLDGPGEIPLGNPPSHPEKDWVALIRLQ